MKKLLLSLSVILGACAGPRASIPSPATVEKPAVEKSAGGLALPFIHDDYGRALAEAKQRELPLFVDVWTTW